MIPAWLKSLAAWIVGLFVHEAVEQVKEEVTKPSTIENANTPDNLRDGFNQFVADKLRDPDSGRQ